MAKQLNIRSDEAFERAKRLAARNGLTTTDVVVRALRKMEDEPVVVPSFDSLPAELKKDHEHFRELARRAREEMGDKAISNHDEFYDESGLPK